VGTLRVAARLANSYPVPESLRHVHVDDREIEALHFDSRQGETSCSFAPHNGGEFNRKDVGQKIANASSGPAPITAMRIVETSGSFGLMLYG
jgi:hypothetical protein